MSYYDLLQVSPTAPVEVIAAAYKALMRQHHPDKGGNPDFARQLNEAFAVLSDPQKRAQYDAQIRAAFYPPPNYPPQPSYPPQAGYPVSFAPQYAMSPAERFNTAMQTRLMGFLDRLADRLDRDASAELDLDDPGQGTVYEMPTPRRRRRA